MKFYETHFEEYINKNDILDLHPKLEKIYNNFPCKLKDLKNLIFYGPQGVGKYTQMLKCIKKSTDSVKSSCGLQYTQSFGFARCFDKMSIV